MAAHVERLRHESAYADPEREPCDVLFTRDSLHDSARNRDVPISVYFPSEVADNKVPVIIWSHGLGGSRDGSSFLHRYHASHGYVVVAVQHVGTDSSIWQGQPGNPWDAIRNAPVSRESTVDRFKDIPFVLDQLSEWANRNPEPGDKMDLDNIGMSGYSFGALTTQVMAGQMVGRPRFMTLFKESRFRAGIAYSPSLPPIYERNPAPFVSPISLPMLYMTGTADSSPRTGQDYTSRLKVYSHSTAKDQYLLVLKDADHMVFGDRRIQHGVPANRDTHEKIIKISSLAYWDAFLKRNEYALHWLRSSDLSTFLGGHASFEHKNPS